MSIASRTFTPELLTGELEFASSRSGGPGGQNVNKVNSKVILRWNIRDSLVITPEEKEMLLHKLSSYLTTQGTLLLTSQQSRSQLENKKVALSKLESLLKKAFAKRKTRRPTKPSKSSAQSRLNQKKKHSEKKKWRQSHI